MPVETMIAVAVIVSAFGLFALILERASRQTQKIRRAREGRARL